MHVLMFFSFFQNFFCRFIKIIDNTFNLMLLGLLVYFGILFALYGFLFVTASISFMESEQILFFEICLYIRTHSLTLSLNYLDIDTRSQFAHHTTHLSSIDLYQYIHTHVPVLRGGRIFGYSGIKY